MSDKSTKIINIFLYCILGISVVFLILYFGGGWVDETAAKPEKNFTLLFLVWAYILIFAAAALAVGFPLAKVIANPKNIKKGLIQVGILIGIVGLAFLLSSAEPMELLSKGTIDDPVLLKYSGTMIITIYLLLGAAVAIIIYNGIAGLLKK